MALVAADTLRRAAVLASPSLHTPERRAEADRICRELIGLLNLAEARGRGAIPTLAAAPPLRHRRPISKARA